jgi:hypothetical protein
LQSPIPYYSATFPVPNKVLELKVHTMYQRAREKAEKKEQRSGNRSIAADLRSVYVAARALAQEEKEVKERLRQLRGERVAPDLDDEPLLNEADSAEVLGEEVSEEEAPLVVPSGFSIRLDPPSIEALTFVGKPASAASIALVGGRVMRRCIAVGRASPGARRVLGLLACAQVGGLRLAGGHHHQCE